MAKKSFVREYSFSPIILVFGREPRYPDEIFEIGNPLSFHFNIIEYDIDLAQKLHFRYHTKNEFAKYQMRSMLRRTLHNHMRIYLKSKAGDRIFFCRGKQE